MFDNASDEQLKQELERREKAKELTKPKRVTQPDFLPLQTLCYDYIDQLDKRGDVDDDLKEYIFEAAMSALFGKNVWNYVRAKTR